MKPTLRQYPLENNESYTLNRYINFNTHRVILELSKRQKGIEPQPVANIIFQNLRPNGDGSTFKGSIEHTPDGRHYDFLYLVDTTVQLATLSYELIKYFDALMTGQPLPEEVDEMLSGTADTAPPPVDDGLSEEDIENMSEDEIQAMMEQEVARTLGSKGEDAADAQDDINALIGNANEANDANHRDNTSEATELSVDDIQNMIMGGGGVSDEPAAAETPATQDEPSNGADKDAATSAPEDAADTEDADNLSAEDIHKMVMESQSEDWNYIFVT